MVIVSPELFGIIKTIYAIGQMPSRLQTANIYAGVDEIDRLFLLTFDVLRM